MQDLNSIKATLYAALDDARLSVEEKAELRDMATSLDRESLSFMRNRAFDIARNQLLSDQHEPVDVLRWLEQLIKVIDSSQPQSIESSAYFSPGDDCRNKLRDLIHGAKTNIDICVFTISDDKLTSAIIKAYQRGVVIRIISDNDKSEDMGSDIDYLQEQGLTIAKDSSPNHMHHKFAIFDGEILVNGSFNWTRSASKNNQENIVVLRDEKLIAQFQQQFDGLWKAFKGEL